MPKKCAVVGCTTNRHHYELGIRFYHIPREDDDLKVRWLNAIGRTTEWKIPSVPIVCEKHFTPDQKVSARNLAPNVVPTLNLPSPEELEPPELPLLKKAKRRASIETKRQPATQRTVQEPEMVFVPTAEEEVLPFESCCRFCSDELKVAEGFSIANVRHSNLVRDAIWNLCWPQEEPTDENGDSKICNVCWVKMQEFDHFVTICHQQQEQLATESIAELSSSIKHSDEQVPEDSEMCSPNEASFYENDTSTDLKDFDRQPEYAEERNSELPPLEGLTIDEMLEVLDKIPAPRKKYDQLNEDEECWDCGRMFPNRSQKKQHRKTCSAIGTSESLRNKSHTCEICGKQLDSRIGYRMHLQKIHKNDSLDAENGSEELKRLMSKKRLMCPLCPDRFEQLHMLKYHLKTHKTKSMDSAKALRRKRDANSVYNYCKLCNKTFQNPSYLDLHMKFHKRERDFVCDQCDKQFFIAQDLKHHKMALHERHTILCGECGKTFGTMRYFKRHMLSHSTDPDSKPFKCSLCTESYHSAAKLRDHMTRHTGEKIHQCELCDQAFRFRHQLTRHKISKHGMQLDRLQLMDTREELSFIEDQATDSGIGQLDYSVNVVD
ncbi:zinc finger protein 426 [Aedes aegypti]|uniref:Uncharacterized protein n=1 Tax=Aedes aegypti TaxID=7159 RepID=A0A8W7IRR6_AEDAE|nr:zinc finger protein 426 [Aedes aegypti]XP_021712594.1 zinc finger protein 426 [Aedes aegypti]